MDEPSPVGLFVERIEEPVISQKHENVDLNFELTDFGRQMGSCLLTPYGASVYTNLERDLTQEFGKENHKHAVKKLVEVLG